MTYLVISAVLSHSDCLLFDIKVSVSWIDVSLTLPSSLQVFQKCLGSRVNVSAMWGVISVSFFIVHILTLIREKEAMGVFSSFSISGLIIIFLFKKCSFYWEAVNPRPVRVLQIYELLFLVLTQESFEWVPTSRYPRSSNLWVWIMTTDWKSSSQPAETPVPSSSLLGHEAHTRCTCICAGKTLIHRINADL